MPELLRVAHSADLQSSLTSMTLRGLQFPPNLSRPRLRDGAGQIAADSIARNNTHEDHIRLYENVLTALELAMTGLEGK